MARKKPAVSHGGGAPWLNTFADLMNLLLCFFVLLFSMSNVDSEKFEDVSVSMANSFGIFEGGGSSIGEGSLISSGMTQMNDLGEYYSNMGEASQKTPNNNEVESNPDTKDGTSDNEDTGSDGTTGSTDGTGSSGDVNLQEALDKVQKEMESLTTEMYDKVSALSEKDNLGDYVNLTLDPNFQFVQITLKGSILFDSGQAELKPEAESILAKIGDILHKFDGYFIEITGYTDNVPMSSSTYKDNNWLSSARALNAAQFLIENSDLDPSKLKYSGRGEYDPISSNATADGRAKNRRIEIKIYNELSGK